MERNLTHTLYKMLMMNIGCIANHPHAIMRAVPSNLLKFWSVPYFTDKPKYENSKRKGIIVPLYCNDAPALVRWQKIVGKAGNNSSELF